MTANQAPIEHFQQSVYSRGKKALDLAITYLCERYPSQEPVADALRFFSKVTLKNALPVFPALISLSCDAVGRRQLETNEIGAGIVLLTGAADIHDDIIDNSLTKTGKPTVLGQFGGDIAIIAADTLLIEGLNLIHKSCLSLPSEISSHILDLIAVSSYDIGRAEVLDSKYRGKEYSPEQFYQVIELKSSVPGVCCKIGALIGGGTASQVEDLGNFGRDFGILSIVAEEFMDLHDKVELQNRLKNEVPPLPLCYALQDAQTRTELRPILKKKRLTQKDVEKISQVTSKSAAVLVLKQKMATLTAQAEKQSCKRIEVRKELRTFASSLTEFFE